MEITELPREELIELGERDPDADMVQQINYHDALVEAEPEVLASLGEGFAKEYRTAATSFRQKVSERAASKVDSKEATGNKGEAIDALKTWRGEASLFARKVKLKGLGGTDDLIETGRGGVREAVLLKDCLDRVGLLEGLQVREPYKSTASALAAQGRELIAAVGRSSGASDQHRRELPADTQELYALKGLLRVALKQINLEAKTLFKAEPWRAEPFDLRYLHRRRPRRDQRPDAGQAPGPASPA